MFWYITISRPSVHPVFHPNHYLSDKIFSDFRSLLGPFLPQGLPAPLSPAAFREVPCLDPTGYSFCCPDWILLNAAWSSGR